MLKLSTNFFSGPHRLGVRYIAESVNRRRIKERCVPIAIDPADLAWAVDEDGVNPYRAKQLVEAMIQRAADEAVARTLGIHPNQ